MKLAEKVASSFRDNAGFLFRQEGRLFRQVNKTYQQNYDKLMNSGLYDELQKQELLVSHRESNLAPLSKNGCKVIEPKLIPFISYAYEWSFEQLRAAALCTLTIQKIALDFNMSLKDASAFNIQFHEGAPILIDTLSFEPYKPDQPWIAYRQFCQHFLAPLALMSLRDSRFGQMAKTFIDGIPLDLAAELLPATAWLNAGLLLHLGVHGKANAHAKNIETKNVANSKMTKLALLALIDNLETTIRNLKSPMSRGFWMQYQQIHNYSEGAERHKEQLVQSYLDKALTHSKSDSQSPTIVWDIGANTGKFSRMAAEKCDLVLSFDMDHDCVEAGYRYAAQNELTNVLPLVCDLSAPTPAIGWAHAERASLLERGSATATLALAVIHHLAIGNNVPLEMIAELFSQMGESLIVEFVPKEDSQVKLMLSSREDIFDDYSRESFEAAFSSYFDILDSSDVDQSVRTLYLMRRHKPRTNSGA